MIYFLILANILLVLFCLRLFGRDYANPAIIYSIIWLVASVFTVFYSLRWGGPLSGITVAVIVLGNLMFIFGILMSSGLIAAQSSKRLDLRTNIKVNNLSFILILGLLFFIVRYVYADLVYLASQAKQDMNGVFKIIELARQITTNYDFATSRLSLNLLRINYAIGIVFFYFFCEALFTQKGQLFYKGKLILISILSLGVSLLSTGRTELLGLISGYGMIYMLFYSNYLAWSDSRYSRKLVSVLIKLGIGFLLLFMLVGNFVLNRIDGEGYLGTVDNLIKYLGSPIQALDYYLTHSDFYPANTVFGQNTLIAIYGSLRSLGLVDFVLTPFLPVVNFNGDRTNVYTIYFYFVKDFGYLSAAVIQFVYGFFYGSLYYIIKKVRFTPMWIITFALLTYSLVISFFQETLLSLLTTHINRIIYAFIIYFGIKLLSKIRVKL